MDQEPEPQVPTLPEMDMSWVPNISDTALVVDLNGAEGVSAGLNVAGKGYRPVPLYNALPEPGARGTEGLHTSVVRVEPIISALWHGTSRLTQCVIRPEAPPAFLLDAMRRTGENVPRLGMFDNRSVSFTTDFPSADFLLAHGISRVLLVQHSGNQPQPDLARTLRGWQEAGLVIELKRLDMADAPEVCQIKKPNLLGRVWYRVQLALGLIQNPLGGFGGYLEDTFSAG